MVAGISGAGRSLAIDSLADLGYFTIENLPVPLLSSFLELSARTPTRYTRTALVVDVDSPEKQQELLALLPSLNCRIKQLSIIFLDCTTEVIIKRYGQTRRPHPGYDPQKDISIKDAVQRERAQLLPIKERADLVIDTSELTVHDLRRDIKDFVEGRISPTKKRVGISFMSFGFKYGLPIDCDLLLDVRFLANPFFIDELRNLTGLQAEVQSYLGSEPTLEELVKRFSDLLEFLLPHYVNSGKSYLSIGIGCTGGRHRSVVACQRLAEEAVRRFSPADFVVSTKHRDIQKPQ